MTNTSATFSREALHVYVVDDDDGARKSLGALLSSLGFSTSEVASGQELIKSLKTNRPSCIVLDLQMPKMSGLEVQRELQNKGFNLPVVFLTGHGDIPAAVEAMKAGAIDFIEKPVEQSQLVATLQRARDFIANRPLKIVPLQVVNNRYDKLTNREKEILDQIVMGKTNKLIAEELQISQRTVEIHRSRVREKMKASSLADLIRMMRQDR